MEITPTGRRRVPDDAETIEALAKRYQEGLTVRQISAETGWAYGTVHRRLSMAEVEGLLVMRPRGYRTLPSGSR